MVVSDHPVSYKLPPHIGKWSKSPDYEIDNLSIYNQYPRARTRPQNTSTTGVFFIKNRITPTEFAMSINLKNLTFLLVVGLFLQSFVFSKISVGVDLMKLSPIYSPKVEQPLIAQITTQAYTTMSRTH